MSSLVSINYIDPTFANRPRFAYINCDDIVEIADHYDKDGRLLSSNSKLTLSSGKTYIVVEPVSDLAARIAQECPAPANIAGPQGPPGATIASFALSGELTAGPSGAVTQISSIYLIDGALDTSSSKAFLQLSRIGTNNNNPITGKIVLVDQSNNAICEFELNTTSSSLLGPTTIISPGTISVLAGWYNVALVSQGSVGAPNNSCLTIARGLYLVYQ